MFVWHVLFLKIPRSLDQPARTKITCPASTWTLALIQEVKRTHQQVDTQRLQIQTPANWLLGGSSHLVSGLVHPSYKWTNPTKIPLKSPGCFITHKNDWFVGSSPPSGHHPQNPISPWPFPCGDRGSEAVSSVKAKFRLRWTSMGSSMFRKRGASSLIRCPSR